MKDAQAFRILIRNGTVITLEQNSGRVANRVLERHSVLIEGDRIKKISPDVDLAQTQVDQTIDAAGKVVMPGLINAHMHFYSTLVRGLTKAESASDFQGVLDNLWWRLDRKLTLDDCRVSAMIPLVDAIRKGTTTLIDHHASPFAARGSLQAIAGAVKQTGLRASLCYEVSDRDGNQVANDGLNENIEFIKSTQSGADSHLRALFGLHASFTVGEKTLARAVEAARALNTGFHVHTAEAASDQEHALKTFGVRVVERFHEHGVLGPTTICAHCVHVDDRELALLAQTGTAVVHNPQSNMNNAVGTADILKMKNMGVLVGLGTDAMTVNMFEEARSGVWAQKLRQQDPGRGFSEPLEAVLFNNAIIADRYWNMGLGQLREGGAADLILLDYEAPTPLDSSNFLGHFCFGLAQTQVDTTICAGRVLMLRKKLMIDLDEAKLASDSRQLAASLWARF